MTEATANILVVDDDDGGRYLKAHVLRKHGYHVAEASSGMAAIEQCCAAHAGPRACSTSGCPTSAASR